MNISVIGIDLAKTSFELCAMTATGRIVWRRKASREGLVTILARGARCTIAMEACGSSNYWGRKFKSLGFEVKLIAAKYVKPYVKRNKNDRADAEAIAEASLRPTMRFVGIKSVLQQDMQAVHRVRERCVRARTALANEIRGLLGEYGIIIARGISHIRTGVLEQIEKQKGDITPAGVRLIQGLQAEFHALEEQIDRYENTIKGEAKEHPVCKRLLEVSGIGPVTASALVASVADPTLFKNGREFSAWLGLVPRQHSTGGKPLLLGITKNGDRYLRKLLVHGARTLVRHVGRHNDKRSQWLQMLLRRKGKAQANKALVGMANKNARICWALMVNPGMRFNPNHQSARFQMAA